jgi:hypothetical protein
LKKRVYREGYSIDWNHKKKTTPNSSIVKEEPKTEVPAGEIRSTEHIFVSADHLVKFQPSGNLNIFFPPDSCSDMIFLKSGKDLQATILEIKEESIKYKSCEYPYGGIKETNKEKILMVKFANGTLERYQTEKFDDDSPKVHPLATLSFVSALAALGFLLISFVSLLGLILMFAALITSLVSGYVGKERIMEDRAHNRGLKLIKAAFIITTIISLFRLATASSL